MEPELPDRQLLDEEIPKIDLHNATPSPARTTLDTQTPKEHHFASPVPQPPMVLMHPPPLSASAIDKRLRRAMEPNAKGAYKVSQEIRKLWHEGKRDRVFKLFAQCNNDPETFVQKFSIHKDHQKETELGVYFEFKTEDQLADLPESLC